MHPRGWRSGPDPAAVVARMLSARSCAASGDHRSLGVVMRAPYPAHARLAALMHTTRMGDEGRSAGRPIMRVRAEGAPAGASRLAGPRDSFDLARALLRAADAHSQHEAQTGRPDPDWPSWYAAYLERAHRGDSAGRSRESAATRGGVEVVGMKLALASRSAPTRSTRRRSARRSRPDAAGSAKCGPAATGGGAWILYRPEPGAPSCRR